MKLKYVVGFLALCSIACGSTQNGKDGAPGKDGANGTNGTSVSGQPGKDAGIRWYDLDNVFVGTSSSADSTPTAVRDGFYWRVSQSGAFLAIGDEFTMNAEIYFLDPDCEGTAYLLVSALTPNIATNLGGDITVGDRKIRYVGVHLDPTAGDVRYQSLKNTTGCVNHFPDTTTDDSGAAVTVFKTVKGAVELTSVALILPAPVKGPIYPELR